MKNEEEWKKAKRLCRLSNDDIRMARELGMSPRSLMKNIPSPQQRWKAPVKFWIRDLYEKKFGIKTQLPPPRAPRIVDTPAPPDNLFEPDIIRVFDDFRPPTRDEIVEEDEFMQRRQRNFRLAADYVAAELAKFETIKRIVLFGSAASSLEKEVPRFRKFRRAGQPIYHECKDVDLAVWISALTNLDSLRGRGQRLSRLCWRNKTLE